MSEGSLSKAARVLMKGIWPLSRSVLSELQSLHPEGDLGLFQTVRNSIAPLVVTEDEVLKAVKSFAAGSAFGSAPKSFG